MLSDVCLSVTYIGPKSRTERPRKTKIGTEVAHVTRDSDTAFKVKRSTCRGRGHIVAASCTACYCVGRVGCFCECRTAVFVGKLLLLSCAKSHMLSASRRQPHLLHVSAVDCRQTWSMDKS